MSFHAKLKTLKTVLESLKQKTSVSLLGIFQEFQNCLCF